MARGISENWIGKAECFDGCFDLIDLALGMSTRIAWIGNEIAHRAVGDDQPRRFCRRYFVHTRTCQNDDRRRSPPLQLENAQELESGQGVPEHGRPPLERARSAS